MTVRSDASFPEPESFNGDYPSGMRRARGPEPWKCLECCAGGAGFISRNQHWRETGGYDDGGHHIVFGCDPRAKTAPRGK